MGMEMGKVEAAAAMAKGGCGSVKALAEHYGTMGMLDIGAAYRAMGITEGDAAAKIAGPWEQGQLMAMAYAHTERGMDAWEILEKAMEAQPGSKNPRMEVQRMRWADRTWQLIGSYRRALAGQAQDKKQEEP